jgi:hypothetical protein
MEILLKHFTPRSHPELFHPYLELMYKVFVSEQGWRLESNHRRKKIEVTLEDISSVFVVAIDADSRIIAGVKGSLPSFNFPDSSLYQHHIGYQGIEQTRDVISVVKGLVVAEEYRNRKFLINGKEKSLGVALLEHLLSILDQHGSKIIFTSATVYEAAVQMQQVGFRVIDYSAAFDGLSRAAIHMALTDDKAALKYFHSREKVLLGSTNAIEYFNRHLGSSEKQSKQARASVG